MRCVTGLLTGLLTLSPKLTFELEGEDLPVRLDLFLRQELPAISRAQIQRFIRSGAAKVNDQTIDIPSTRVDSGDTVEFDAPHCNLVDAQPLPQNLNFRVIHEDDHIVVVDKPAGLAVHAGAGRPDHTLVNGLLARYPEISNLEPADRPGIVHRLDADTSGVMVVARSPEAATALSVAIKAREIDRRYIALVLGKLPPGAGLIDRPIGRHPTIRTRQAIVPDGKPARTRFASSTGLYAFGKHFSMVNVKLETGRTHQIRVHMQAIGFPIVGDPVYGVSIPELSLERQFLHAISLSFDHPITGEPQRFTSPLPPELSLTLAKIGPPSSTGFGNPGYGGSGYSTY